MRPAVLLEARKRQPRPIPAVGAKKRGFNGLAGRFSFGDHLGAGKVLANRLWRRFTRNLTTLELPVRQGEGRLVAPPAVLDEIKRLHLGPLRYIDPRSGQPTESFGGLCDPSGRLLGPMPHPEAFLHAENHPHWRRQLRREESGGLQIFRNAVACAERG